MNMIMANKPRLNFSRDIFPRVLLAVAGGGILFIILMVFTVSVYASNHNSVIYPGISISDLDLSGMDVPKAISAVRQHFSYPQEGRIVFQDGQQLWLATPAEVGLFLNPESSAISAFGVGRQGGMMQRFSSQLQAWSTGVRLPPQLIYDQRLAYQYLEKIASEINRPVIEASIQLNGIEVIATAGQIGRQLDIEATLSPLEVYLRSMTDGVLPLVIHETPPEILDASAQAEIARKMLNAPLALVIPDPRADDPKPWIIDQDTLARMITLRRVTNEQGTQIEVGLNQDSLQSFLDKIALEFDSQTRNARFIFNDETRELELIESAIIGRSLNIDATLNEINLKLNQGEHHVNLQLEYQYPQIKDDAQATDLGISELVTYQTSYFYGSSASRIQNIQIAAARFHGVLVPPGAEFSMAEILGDVSLDNGYAEALIIFGNRTIKGVGGGVCQVSTTLFRTAFFGGFPIVERYPHAYRVTYYELTRQGSVDTNLAGLDATVFVPVVDFKFRNDTPHWLLMETYVNSAARTLTWKFYSTSDDRKVEWKTTGLLNLVDPDEPILQENPELAKNEIKQVDWEVQGADVTVTRVVYRNNQVYLEDTFYTHYLPWRAVYEYGPGSNLSKLLAKLLPETLLP